MKPDRPLGSPVVALITRRELVAFGLVLIAAYIIEELCFHGRYVRKTSRLQAPHQTPGPGRAMETGTR